jgi:cell division protein FtsZ
MLFEFDSIFEQKAELKVVGVGGAGGNAVNRMINSGMEGVDFCVINTDAQDLEKSLAAKKIQIGKSLTKGLGAGAKAELGRQAITEDREAVQSLLTNADMVFITAGMGGGTGTGAAPMVAEISKEMGILTVGIVTLPFSFEGPKRMVRGLTGVTELRKICDTLLIIPNQKLMSIVDRGTTLTDSFQIADSILHQAARGISDLINVHGMINLDFADVETIMSNMGEAIMGTGTASGDEKAVLAAQQAISSPLLDNASISGAQGVLVNITGGPKMTLFEVDEAASIIFEEAGQDANLIFGAVIDPSMEDQLQVTVIATGFSKPKPIEEPTDWRPRENMPQSEHTRYLTEQKNTPLHEQEDNIEIIQPVDAKPKFRFEGDKISLLDQDLEVPAFLRRQSE